MDFQEQLARYADLVLRRGVNLQKGQLLLLKGELCHRAFLRILASRAYALGASYVSTDYVEPHATRDRINLSEEQDLQFVPSFVSAKYNELLDSGAAVVSVVGEEDPMLLEDLDPQRINMQRQAFRNAIKRFYDEGIGQSKVHWTVVAAATPRWAARVFPELGVSPEAETRLWDAIFSCCRLDRADYIQEWIEHDARLKNRAKKLNALKIRELHFVGPGTDLSVLLSDRARFAGGSETSASGILFEPNLPTEECFTTPDWRGTTGYVRATRPVQINGKLIRGLQMRFHEGKITDFSAESGAETFRTYIESDAGACRLGEVALVGVDSPIYQSGLVFEEILFDENAACHIAIGSAYKFCLEESVSMSADDFANLGCNESGVHTDIMISSEDVNVTAILSDGSAVQLLECGQFTKDLR